MKNNIIINNITRQQIEIQIQDELLRTLENVPILNDVDVYASRHNGYDIEANAKIASDDRLNIICEVKSKGEPQYIRKAVNKLIELKEKLEKNSGNKYYCMIAAPYLSQASSKICEEMGMGYIDLSGNCMLIYKGIYIQIEGKPNKYKENRGSKSIFERSSIKSSMILRYILQNPDKQWKLQELADVSSSSIGQVSKVKKYLEEREYISSGQNGFFVKRPKEIILEWAKVYNSKPNTVYECYSVDSIPQIEHKLIEVKEKSGIEYAITGFSGGVRYSPAVRYSKIHVYIPLQDLQEAIKILGCKKVTSGSNVAIIVPYDPCIMMDVRNIKGTMVVSPVQVCLDLMGLKGRGEEAATAIMEKEF